MSRTELTDRVRRIFGAFDAKDVPGFTAFVTDDVRVRLGNAEVVQGKPAFVAAVEAFLASVAEFRHEVIDMTPVYAGGAGSDV